MGEVRVSCRRDMEKLVIFFPYCSQNFWHSALVANWHSRYRDGNTTNCRQPRRRRVRRRGSCGHRTHQRVSQMPACWPQLRRTGGRVNIKPDRASSAGTIPVLESAPQGEFEIENIDDDRWSGISASQIDEAGADPVNSRETLGGYPPASLQASASRSSRGLTTAAALAVCSTSKLATCVFGPRLMPGRVRIANPDPLPAETVWILMWELIKSRPGQVPAGSWTMLLNGSDSSHADGSLEGDPWRRPLPVWVLTPSPFVDGKGRSRAHDNVLREPRPTRQPASGCRHPTRQRPGHHPCLKTDVLPLACFCIKGHPTTRRAWDPNQHSR